MIESAWLFLGRMAFVWTLVVLVGTVYVSREDDDTPLILGSIIGVVFWGIWAFGALQVETTSSGVVMEFSSPPLLVVGIAMMIVNGYVAIEGSMSAISRWNDAEPEDF